MDTTRDILSKYISTTNELIIDALKLYDSSATSKIITTMELGFPNDVIRLAGGFVTGLYVKWDAGIPFIPIDTTVNVCTTSLFKLSNDIGKKITPELIQNVHEQLLQLGFRSNFDRGNHFIIYAKSRISNQFFLILHSDTYKEGYESMSPEINNWYFNDIKILTKGNRYLRYIIGDTAQEYYIKTKYYEKQNILKHRHVANGIVGGDAMIVDSQYLHHHYMPTPTSVLIGCYLIKQNTIIPILSSPGRPIYLYKFENSLQSNCGTDNLEFIVPHGWGRYFDGDFSIQLDLKNNILLLNNDEYSIQPKQTFKTCESIKVRSFKCSGGDDEYLKLLQKYYTGINIDMLDQVVAYNKTGYKRFENEYN
jgi:hypothetical protein